MKRKFLIVSFIVLGLYGAFFFWYLFISHQDVIQPEDIGSSIDPSTFMTDREQELSQQYSKVRDFLFFLGIPYEWLFYSILLIFGISQGWEKWAEKISKTRVVQIILFCLSLSVTTYVVFYPLRFIRYTLSKSYNISTQSFSSWMRDGIIDFWIESLTTFIIVMAFFWLLKKFPNKWWFFGWLITVPVVIFYMFIQPVLIDPLYNDFYPLKNKELESKILELASMANIPAEHVFEVNMSEKTNALNAYVTGIGSNSRIVLWDTTLNRLNEEEILFIMAHEMAHYVEKHIYIGIAGYLIFSLFVFYLLAKILKWVITRYGKALNIHSLTSLSVYPLVLLIFSVLLFMSSPFENAISRYQEMRADRYAIELTKDAEAGVSTFQKLTKSGLSQVDPPLLVKWFRYGHPTMKERILMVEEYKEMNSHYNED